MVRLKGFLFSLILTGLTLAARAQNGAYEVYESDTANPLVGSHGFLLEDKRTRNETTTAINAMYNFKFEQSNLEFRFLEAKNPEHPLPTFLLGLETWWHIVPNEEDTQYDDYFFELMEKTAKKAQKLWDQQPGNLEAAFFLSASYGFRGRLNAYRHNWRRATNDGRLALKWMEVSRGKGNLSSEFLFGDALFNYYQQYIHENYPVLRPVLAFFPKGDKKLGLEQLTTVSRNAFYTRTEAQTYLMRIYANEENTPSKAYPLAAYLAKTFPDNPFYQRSLARMAFSTGRMSECFSVSQQIRQKFLQKSPGYEYNSLRYADYFMGYYNLFSKRDSAAAAQNFRDAIADADLCKMQKSGYTLYSLFYLGLIEYAQGNHESAEERMKEILHRGDNDQAAYADAKSWLAQNERKRKRIFGLF